MGKKIIMVDDLAVVLIKVSVLLSMGLLLLLSKLTRDENLRFEIQMQEFGLRMIVDNPYSLPEGHLMLFRFYAITMILGIVLGISLSLARAMR